jgi:hypothetical protein
LTLYGKSLKEFERQICENTVISILDYVEWFRHKLTRACEIQQYNFKQSQDKMKQWYDKDAMIRQFKPGEKVIVLLLITFHPLQANYFWPYVIESRLNDLNYIVNTPTRRKNRHKCELTA